jgi:KipI family sensor histidine kinase inhibitor
VFTTHVIPVRYDGQDIDEVAERLGMSRQDVAGRHAAREYRVLALGFLPGWAYLGPLDPSLALPRRSTPRTRVPAGSVAIMGAQTGVYPQVSPGGWHLIGTTKTVLFDAGREPPTLFRAGDRVQFVPE